MALSFCGKRLLLTKTTFLSTIRNHGYIILVPEIGEDSPEKNPLIQSDGLPQFNNITIENCMAAIAKQTLDFEDGIKQIEKNLQYSNNNVFNTVFKPLEEYNCTLDMTWGLAKTLYLSNCSLMPTKNYLAVHERAKRARAAKFNSLSIFEAVKQELANPQEKTDEEMRMLKKFALEGRLNGLELIENQKIKLEQCLKQMRNEQIQFKGKIETITQQFQHEISDFKVVRDFPTELLEELAENPQTGPWKLTLEPNNYLKVMENCSNRQLRCHLWLSSVIRGSGYSNKEFSTSIHLENIRKERKEMARILGFKSFTEMSMQTKMAGSYENITSIWQVLLERAKPIQERELADLLQFAQERGFKGERIELWDLPYWRKKQQLSLFNYREEDYSFQLSLVLNGLFQLTEKLFNIQIRERRQFASIWHRNVKFYDIFERDSSAPIAGFYLDLYKTGHGIKNNKGWMVSIQNRSQITETKPLAALIFNFPPPVNDISMLSLGQVQVLFNRFGQVLQHLLTRTTYGEVAGMSNIEWDAVEICSNVLTEFLYEKPTLDLITSNQMPEEKMTSLQQAHKHFNATKLCRDLYLSALDLELHNSEDYWLDIVKRLWPEYRSFPLDKLDSHPCSFTQIFTDEWGAAYYSHLWSKMVAADCFVAFYEMRNNESKMLDVGKRFRDTFLAMGGSCHPSQVFRKFRGRDPSPRALLGSLGIKKK